ncbi:hypothetical protein D9M70_497750 [compost metagenome]
MGLRLGRGPAQAPAPSRKRRSQRTQQAGLRHACRGDRGKRFRRSGHRARDGTRHAACLRPRQRRFRPRTAMSCRDGLACGRLRQQGKHHSRHRRGDGRGCRSARHRSLPAAGALGVSCPSGARRAGRDAQVRRRADDSPAIWASDRGRPDAAAPTRQCLRRDDRRPVRCSGSGRRTGT